MSDINEKSERIWYLDSGANQHITPNLSWFSKYEDFLKEEKK